MKRKARKARKVTIPLDSVQVDPRMSASAPYHYAAMAHECSRIADFANRAGCKPGTIDVGGLRGLETVPTISYMDAYWLIASSMGTLATLLSAQHTAQQTRKRTRRWDGIVDAAKRKQAKKAKR